MNQYDPSTAAGMAYDEIREGQRQQLRGLCPSDATNCSASSEVDKEQAGTRAIIQLAKDAGCENDSQIIGFLARQVFDFIEVLTMVGNNLPHIECRTAFTLNQRVQSVLSRQNDKDLARRALDSE